MVVLLTLALYSGVIGSLLGVEEKKKTVIIYGGANAHYTSSSSS